MISFKSRSWKHEVLFIEGHWLKICWVKPRNIDYHYWWSRARTQSINNLEWIFLIRFVCFLKWKLLKVIYRLFSLLFSFERSLTLNRRVCVEYFGLWFITKQQFSLIIRSEWEFLGWKIHSSIVFIYQLWSFYEVKIYCFWVFLCDMKSALWGNQNTKFYGALKN